MDTKINVDRLFFDVSNPKFTLVLLHYTSDEPAHPVWGGGVKRKEYDLRHSTGQIMQLIFEGTGMQYLRWDDARPEETAWLMQQPGASPFPEPSSFDSTPPEAAGIVAIARRNFRFAQFTEGDQNELKVSVVDEPKLLSLAEHSRHQLPEVAPIYTVTFRRHDALSPWVAKEINPRP